LWAETLKAKTAEMAAAKAANDTKKVQDLDAWGSAGPSPASCLCADWLKADERTRTIVRGLK
jgi:hypothetical protein